MDLTESITPRSDQMNSDDLIGGPRTVTITDVQQGSAEQPVNIHLAEFPRPFKPSKSMRRVMVHAWGKDSAAYLGKRMTLYRDPTIRFGKDEVGGIRISHMSGIPHRGLKIALTVTRGKRAPFEVQLLPDDAPTSAPVSEETVARVAELRQEWGTATAARKKEIEDQVASLNAEGADTRLPEGSLAVTE